ncbi:MAG: hypothetical protein IT391_10865 [Nitrospira sp.]|nr:hypothetical protein [Nitrospira sp.]
MNQHVPALGLLRWASALVILMLGVVAALAEPKDHQGFHMVATDENNIETELQRTVFYYEEMLNETSFIPHELNALPLKRGATIVQVKFQTIQQIEFKPGLNGEAPTAIVMLTNGKAGEFQLAIMGSFKGLSDFGEVQVPVSGVRKVVFR